MVGIVINNVFGKSPMKISKRGENPEYFSISPAYSRHFRPEKKFSKQLDSTMFWALLIRIFVQKSGKSNDEILRKSPKTSFTGIFPEFLAQKNMLFWKISISGQKIFFFFNQDPSHLGITILHLCAKNQKKLISQTQEKLATDW